MPMKTFKTDKNNKKPQLKKNVKKGFANNLEAELFKQDNRAKQIWESQRKKYEYKEEQK